MEQTSPRPWYKKKRYLIPLGAVALIALGSNGSPTPPPSQPIQPAAAAAVLKSAQTSVETHTDFDPAPTAHSQTYPSVSSGSQVSQTAPAQTQSASQSRSPSLSNNNYYTNVDGNQVHSPVYSNSVPAGATAQCRDGTYSFSQHRSGTCSHRGGVASWL